MPAGFFGVVTDIAVVEVLAGTNDSLLIGVGPGLEGPIFAATGSNSPDAFTSWHGAFVMYPGDQLYASCAGNWGGQVSGYIQLGSDWARGPIG